MGMPGKERIMENYIVRIYRFQKDNPRGLVGIVESVEGERREKRAFTNLEDLWRILNSQLSETVLPQQGGAAKETKASAPTHPVDILMGLTMKVIVEARRLSREQRVLLIGNAVKKAGNGEIVVLADDDNAKEDISLAARNHGWMLKEIELQGDSYRITISKDWR